MVSIKVSYLWMQLSTFYSAYNKDSLRVYPPPLPPWQSALPLPTDITYEQLVHVVPFLWAFMWFCLVRPSYCVPTLFTYNTTIWYWVGEHLKSKMKGNESLSLPWITYQELKLDPTYWEGRETVSPNKAQPPWHIQSLISLPPGFGTRGSTAVPRIKALSPACSQAKTACF